MSYDVVDHSLTAICQARLCPHVRCQPKDGVRADVSFHREARAWSADSLLVAWGLYHSPPTFFRKHNFTQARHLSSGVWLVCSLLSQVMALSKIWYVLYPLGSTAFALNNRESQIGGSCLTSPIYIPKWLVLVVWSCLLEAFSDHGECFLTGHALLVYEE